MNRLKAIFKYVSAYRFEVWMTVIAHVFSAVFTVISLPLIIPFFQILFDSKSELIAEPESIMQADQYVKYYFSNLVHTYSKQDALLIVCIFIVVAFFFKNLFRYLASYFITPVRNSLVADIRDGLYKKYLTLPMSFFTEESKGNLITRMSSDITEIEHSILNMLEGAFKAPFIIIGCLVFMLYLSPALTLFVFCLLIVMVFIVGTISRSLRRDSGQAQSSVSRIVSQLEESLGGMKVVKAFQAEQFQEVRFSHENRYYKDALTKIIRRRDLSSPLSEFLGVTIVATLLYYGSRLVFSGGLNPGTFFAFIFAFYSIIEPAKLLSNAYFNMQKGLASVDRLEEMHVVRNPIKESEGSEILNSLQKEIVFNKVTFQYPGSDIKVLKNISLSFQANTVSALVGLSGAGKTSLVDLIPRFYDTTLGDIIVDGKEIKSYTLDSLRNQIGLVSQDAVLFNDTIENNILFGQDNKTKEDIISAAKLANAYDFIMDTEQGFQTIVGDRGVKLSGGQRQRITIARAILKNPPILILDEATSALDAESEKLVQEALNKFIKGRTTIAIAHRLSTIQNADQIYVLRDGELVEEGTHTNLIDKKGEYYRFVQLQELN